MVWGDIEGVGVTVRGYHEGDLCGDGIVLYLDSSGGYMTLYL